MTELNKHHCSKRIQAWTSAFLLTLAIIAGLIWKTGPAYAAPTNDGREPYTLYFVTRTETHLSRVTERNIRV